MTDRTGPRQLAAREKERQALELRKAGASYEQIAHQLKYANQGGAYKAVKRALDNIPAPAVAELRRIQGERIETLILALWPEASKGRWLAIDRVIRLMEREAALFGLDAPVQVDLTNRIRTEADRLAERYGLNAQALIAEAERFLREDA
ncbi:MAG TPA: hypothetical protein VKU87_00090 [Thermomicrobiaceae bacterium]|nr:hypothetical protein [Thermomicrobiaceae bacterium]